MTAQLQAIRPWHRSIIAMFALLGPAGMSLLVRLPEIKDLLGVSTSQLGLLLFSGAVGSICALTITGRIVARFGTKPPMMIGFYIVALGLIGQTLGALNQSWITFGLMIFITGFGYGIADVPINVDGSTIETKLGRSVLPRMHAAYSVGALAGSGLGTVCIALNISLLTQILVLCTLMMAMPVIVFKFVPAHTAQDLHHRDEAAAKPEKVNLFKDPRIVLLGVGILCITLAEGAANDWLALSVVEGYNESPANAGIAFAVFNLSMTITRFFGGSISDRFGRRHTVQAMALTGAIGLLFVIFGPSVIFAWIGAALWGIGAALGFPLFISEAGEGENAARKVTLVTTFGYFAFLVGPPSLGFIAQAIGLLPMLFIVAALLLVAVGVARVMSNRKL